MDPDPLDYPRLLQEALRHLVRRALGIVAEHGMPPGHHFYVGFRSTHPEVEMAEELRRAHPEEMTVVLQHQFWDLEVDKHGFAVSLSFSGVTRRVHVPFAAITTFADPDCEFALRFEPIPDEDPAPAAPARPSGSRRGPDDEPRGPAEVVRIDTFRKR